MNKTDLQLCLKFGELEGYETELNRVSNAHIVTAFKSGSDGCELITDYNPIDNYRMILDAIIKYNVYVNHDDNDRHVYIKDSYGRALFVCKFDDETLGRAVIECVLLNEGLL